MNTNAKGRPLNSIEVIYCDEYGEEHHVIRIIDKGIEKDKSIPWAVARAVTSMMTHLRDNGILDK